MIRFLMSTVAAAVLLAAPVAASAATDAAKPATKPAKPAMHAVAKHGKAKMTPVRSRDSGSASVDQLNEQSLAKARAGQ